MVTCMTTLKSAVLVAAALGACFASAPTAEAQRAKASVRQDVAPRSVVRQKAARVRSRRAVAASYRAPVVPAAYQTSREVYFCAPSPI